MRKTLYMLIGPKGSGKTYIGTVVGERTDITFLRVESIWLRLDRGEDGWQKVAEAVDRAFRGCDKLMIESLGAGADFQRFYRSLKKTYDVKLIRIISDPDICLARVMNRDASDHIPVSDSRLAEYNKIAFQVKLDWAMELDNRGPASAADIIAAIGRL